MFMDKLELKVPPVLLFVIFMVLMFVIDTYWIQVSIGLPYSLSVFVACLLTAVFVGIAGVYEFRKAKTTVNPLKPHNASSVVDSGIFSLTRNPMYLGLFLVLLGMAYWQQNPANLVLSFGFIFYMNRFQIEPEEKALEQLFGAEYVDYKQSVRRWV